jgi:hypothetical protein
VARTRKTLTRRKTPSYTTRERIAPEAWIFEGLQSRTHDASDFLYAFDLLALDGTDIRRERLDERAPGGPTASASRRASTPTA